VAHEHYEAGGELFLFNFEALCPTEYGSQMTTPADAYCVKGIK
jgi:hypothetical protein